MSARPAPVHNMTDDNRRPPEPQATSASPEPQATSTCPEPQAPSTCPEPQAPSTPQRSKSRTHSSKADLNPPSPRLLALFRMYVRVYLRRHFHALRIAHRERCPQPASGHPAAPLILYINHPSWWDPLTSLIVATSLLPASEHYGPMDSAALAHYSFFRRLGMFPVEAGTPRGAAQFLRSSVAALSRGGVLWVPPEGAFTDVRTRPLHFKPGLGALISRLPHAVLLPVAFEYTFWQERLPEILVNIGHPLAFESGHTPEEANTRLKAAMARTLDELATLSTARNPAAFHTLLSGAAGVAGVYNTWQRMRAKLRGEVYRPEHGSIRRP
ncbi:MAG TPA: 1-acyl-sn-glycerol-3-phosphate acyltransferase [Acidisarcina sp.]